MSATDTDIDVDVDQSRMKISDEIAIQITGMHKWYGSFHVLKDINLTVN
ncbi:MAG: amino acid ABC transporter ATP-binding protein, partial [Alphaproteobacteria bacterium]|nr:amino acid ABC transporter ATP-binding protein [Alphaproteobacteria bacterium]